MLNWEDDTPVVEKVSLQRTPAVQEEKKLDLQLYLMLEKFLI